MHRNSVANTVLILGGAGMVGLQVALESARELRPSKIVIAGLTEAEARDAVDFLRNEMPEPVQIIPAWGDIFLPKSLQGRRRSEIAGDPEAYDTLFREIFSPDADHEKSMLFDMIEEHQPDVIVDSINTATAISYQDEFKSSEKTYALLRAIENASGDGAKLAKLPEFINSVRELLISQGVPQIARHILFLHRVIERSSVRIYVKVGTTGTGGMGLNIPYTHSEDKPSLQLLAKSAIGFAHTGLLFLLARTPSGSEEKHGTIIKEVKPGAMIGFRRVASKHVTLRGEKGPAYLIEPVEEELGDSLQLRGDAASFPMMEGPVPLRIVGADTGENGFFSIGEFQAITYPRQMEYITPEEVARLVVLEIIGASTGRDVISAIDGAIADPSYRAGVIRAHAMDAMESLEKKKKDEVLPSIAIGHLGPPRLSKLLAEAYVIEGAAGEDLATIRAMSAEELQQRIETFLSQNGSKIQSLVVTIGVPILRERDGKLFLMRGPRISIPPPPAEGSSRVALTAEAIERYARNGWVDLRLSNLQQWVIWLRGIDPPDVESHGSAALNVRGYASARFIPGEIVGWLLTNESDEQGLVGRRLY